MRNDIVIGFVLIAGCTTASHTHDEAADAASAAVSPAKLISSETAAPASRGLEDLDSMTFDCPKAGLNAAAREAAKAPSQGTYQFSYFRIVNDAHHATYEVHFKSNYVDEPELRYCVSIYCQQGWDASRTMVGVTLMSNEKRAAACGDHGNRSR